MRPRTSPIWTIPLEELRTLVDRCQTYSEVLRHFGLTNKGNNSVTLKSRLKQEGISTDKFVGNWGNGARFKKAAPLESLLVENSKGNRGHLKARLLKEGVLAEQCSVCGGPPEWQGERLVLVLDHINGVGDDNRLENLRLLCPNCNSQTSTFAGRNATKSVAEKAACITCGEALGCKRSRNCVKCYKAAKRNPRRPSSQELERLLWEKPVTKIAVDLGVSDSVVHRWAKQDNLTKPSLGYWQKLAASSNKQDATL